jgi:type II secretory pathway pseudopilin PulG
MRRENRHNGYLLTELMVAMAVLIIILTCMAMMLKVFKNINQFHLARQQCVSASQAQLDSIAITGQPISEKDFKRLWPKMNIEIVQTAGKEQWQGLELIKVKATAGTDNKKVSVELARYVVPKGKD